MKNIRTYSLLLALLTLTGCVTGTRSITLELPTQETSARHLGAIYIGNVKDARVFEAKPKIPEIPSVKGGPEKKTSDVLNTYVGRQRNGYGMAMGSVSLANGRTVQEEVRALIEEGLNASGYSVASSAQEGKTLNVDIQKFWAWMVPGFISVGFESQVEVTLSVDGQPDKRKVVSGFGNNEGQVASNANWALTYKRAYQDFLVKMKAALADMDF